jgi:4-amino-4-deoxy-L-arabinose transferase-like glycosyltransferase
MLITLPFLAGLLIFLDLMGLQEKWPSKLKGWQVALLQAVIIMGVITVFESEILSLFHLLTQPCVAVVWLLVIIVALWLGLRLKLVELSLKRLEASFRSLDRFTVVTLAAFTLIFLLLLVIVLIAPPNNVDSLMYHMSRVMHWAQDKSLSHYPVGFEPQLTNPIGAELIILQFRLLVGNDKLASLPQWLSLVICTISVSVAARLLGAKRKGQLVAAAFAISIPMGLLQATSTQNDYVTALWLIIMIVFILYACQEEPGWAEILSIGAALGLGLLTKGTFYPYAVPWGVWLIVHWIKQKRWAVFARRSLAIIIIVIMLNAGYWARNIITYGGPLGPAQWVSSMTTGNKGLKPIASNLVKNLTINLATPSTKINDTLVDFIKSTFQSSDPNATNFKLNWRWNHEDIAGNPIQLLLVIVLIIVIFVMIAIGRLNRQPLLWYTLAAIFSFVIFTLVSHYDLYGVRYQLPLMVIWAPAFGFVIARLNRRWLIPLAIMFFFVISLPYVFFNSTRPLIAIKNGPEPYAVHPLPGTLTTMSSSIFFSDQTSLVFANWPEMMEPYKEITQAISDSGCTQVGLRLGSHEYEYPIWWLLNAPQSGIRIESIYYSDQLARYADPKFKPCAIFCTNCGERTHLHGLNLARKTDLGINLFTGDSYSPLEGK